MENNIISELQAAYLKGDSTTQQLLYIVHQIRKSWQSGKVMQGIFLDIDGAFEKVWHLGLLAKLEQVNVSGKCLELFQSYSTNRQQVTVVDGCKSEVRTITAGIPQGSKLGPILFILYTNDIQKKILNQKFYFILMIPHY